MVWFVCVCLHVCLLFYLTLAELGALFSGLP